MDYDVDNGVLEVDGGSLTEWIGKDVHFGTVFRALLLHQVYIYLTMLIV